MNHPRRLLGLIAALVLVVAGCNDQEGGGGPVFTATTAATGATSAGTSTSGATTSTSTSAGDTSTTAATTTTTTEPPTTTTTTEPVLDLSQALFGDNPVEPVKPAGYPEGAEALLVGGPNYVASDAIVTDLTDAGFDLTGVEVTVWPVAGTGHSLLVLEFSDDATAFAEGEVDSDALLEALAFHPLIDPLEVTQLVMNVRGADDQGAYVLTAVTSIADLRGIINGDIDAADVTPLLQLERLGS